MYTIVAVAYKNSVYNREILDMTGYFSISFGPHKAEWAASFLKDRVE
jgi:hypothetical protein